MRTSSRTTVAPRARAIRPSRAATAAAYLERVNLAIDHVLARLEEPLRLTAVAKAAHLSPFHFHRVFQAIMGQTLADFVKHRRLEKALLLMSRPGRPSLTEIGLACGFASSSDFSRSFKLRFGASPSAFNLDAWRRTHREELEAVLSRAGSAFPSSHREAAHAGPYPGQRRTRPAATDTVPGSASHLSHLPAPHNPDGFRVKLRRLPARTVAYIRVQNPYAGDGVAGALRRLTAWAGQAGFSDGQWLGYQWENPEITPLEKCQYHVAVEADRFTASGEIGRYRFPAMTVAAVEIRGPIELELRALQWLYGSWLPRSGYVPADQPCFEAWLGPPFAHGAEHFELEIWLPVRQRDVR